MITLTGFVTYLNSNQDNLTFTMELKRATIMYLDVQLYSNDSKVHTYIYQNLHLAKHYYMNNLPIEEYIRAKRTFFSKAK